MIAKIAVPIYGQIDIQPFALNLADADFERVLDLELAGLRKGLVKERRRLLDEQRQRDDEIRRAAWESGDLG